MVLVHVVRRCQKLKAENEEHLVAKSLKSAGADLQSVWGGTLYMPEDHTFFFFLLFAFEDFEQNLTWVHGGPIGRCWIASKRSADSHQTVHPYSLHRSGIRRLCMCKLVSLSYF